ncbi:Flp pilus assembly protein CpaB [Sinomonas sp. R1AF57]|nr:Flp pilus assembly protein CpaB [Sinomonas sp. R1AF57]
MYVSGSDARALAGTETQDVFIVQKQIPAGTSAGSVSASVAKKPVPKAVIPQDAVTDLGAIQGKVAAVALEPGEQLIANRFAEPSALAAPGRVDVPAGLQEVTVRLPIERVIGGAIAAGDTVGVLLSMPKDDSAPAQTQFSFNKVLVTAVQTSTGATAENNASSPASQGTGGAAKSSSGGEYLVTLARSPADAARIVFTAEFGTIYLTKQGAPAQEADAGLLDRSKVLR